MRVVHVTTSDTSLRYLMLDQLLYLRDRGHEVIGVSGGGTSAGHVRGKGIPVYTVPLTRRITPAADARAAVALVSLLRRLRPDLVHTHTPKAGLLGQWAATLARVPRRVHTIHGLYFPGHMRPRHRWRYVLLERLQAAPAHLLLSQNAEDIETCRRERICDPRRLRFLGNGIDIDRFHPRNASPEKIEQVRKALRIPAGDQIVGMVGRIVAEKGYREYFAAAAMVLRRMPKVTFLAIGEAEPWKPGALTTDEHGLGDRMRFLGQRDDMPGLYGAMDLLVLPSHREGFPRSPMEASATGIAVIASDVRGCREAVTQGDNGLLVPVRHPAALAEAIVELLRDPGRRRAMGARGRRIAEERFDQRVVFERVATAYEELESPAVSVA